MDSLNDGSPAVDRGPVYTAATNRPRTVRSSGRTIPGNPKPRELARDAAQDKPRTTLDTCVAAITGRFPHESSQNAPPTALPTMQKKSKGPGTCMLPGPCSRSYDSLNLHPCGRYPLRSISRWYPRRMSCRSNHSPTRGSTAVTLPRCPLE